MVFNKKLLAVSIALIAQGAIAQNDNDEIETEVVGGEITEEVIVFGVRQSLKNSLDAKRDAGNIVDAISAEEVGKLPDNNIAEALQRITGVQIGRNQKGEGGEFQIRGLVNNRVEVNGRGRAVSGFFSNGLSVDETRASNFDSTPSALYKRVEVHKTPQAKHVEGSSGGTVKLVSWKPLDFKDDTTFNFSAEGIDDSLADDLGTKFTGLFSQKIDAGNAGQFGILVNIQYEDEYNKFQEVSTQISQAEYFGEGFRTDAVGVVVPMGTVVDFNDDTLFSVLEAQNPAVHDLPINFNQELNSELATAFMPNNFAVEERDFETESIAVDFNIQWQINDRFELSFQYETTESDEFGNVNILRGNIRDRQGVTKYVAEALTRPISSEEVLFVPGSRDGNTNRNRLGNPQFTNDIDRGVTPYTGDITRYFISAGAEDGFHNGANQANRALNVRGETNSIDREGEFFFLEGKWEITDSVKMEFGYSDSFTERDQFIFRSNFDLGIDPARYTTPNPETGQPFFSGRVNRGPMNPTIGWNYRNGHEVPDILIGLDYINQARAAQEDADGNSLGLAPLTLTSPELYQFGNLNAPNNNNFISFGDLTEATLDFDWELENGVISSVEFGWRRTEESTDRERYQFGMMHYDTFLASQEQGFRLLSADGRQSDTGEDLTEFFHRQGNNANIENHSVVGSEWVNNDADPNNDVVKVGQGNDYQNIVSYYDANAGDSGLTIGDFLGGPGNYGIPFGVGGGDIPREFLTPRVYTREGWQGIFETYFPGRAAHECGADGVCAHELIGINPDTGEYYTQADRDAAREGDVGAIQRAGYFFDPEAGRLLEETTDAFYIQANLDTEVSGIPLTGNFGVRYVNTDVFSFQRSPGTEGADLFGFVPGNASYSELLPSINLTFEVMDRMFVKLAASRTIERQDPQNLAFKRSFNGLNGVAISDDPELTLGNPGLNPTSSRNFDISWEWYFNDESLVSLAYFRKNQEDIVDDVRTQVRYTPTVDVFNYDDPNAFWNPNDPNFDAEQLEMDGFDLSNPFVDSNGEPMPGFTPNEGNTRNPAFRPEVDFTFSDDVSAVTADEFARGVRILSIEEPRNVDDATIDGWELSYQQPFTFLPEPFDGFGTLINATFVDSERDTGVQEYSGTPRPLNKLSDETYNIILYYEKFGFSARIAYNWRSEWRGGFAARYDAREFLIEDPDAARRNAQDPTVLRSFSQAPVDGDEYENSLSKTDISLSYDFPNHDVKIYLQADDIFENISYRYLEPSTAFVRRYRNNGTVWRFGVSAKLGM